MPVICKREVNFIHLFCRHLESAKSCALTRARGPCMQLRPCGACAVPWVLLLSLPFRSLRGAHSHEESPTCLFVLTSSLHWPPRLAGEPQYPPGTLTEGDVSSFQHLRLELEPVATQPGLSFPICRPGRRVMSCLLGREKRCLPISL